MEKYILFIFLLTISTGCFQNRNQKNETNNELTSESTIQNDTLIMFQGIWIHHDKAGFTLLDLRNIRNIQFYYYSDNEIELNETDPKYKDFFYTSNGVIKYCGSNKLFQSIQLSIQTDKYRFDYILRNDSLYLWEETGLEEPLIRMESVDK
jgi:hypothetical protein